MTKHPERRAGRCVARRLIIMAALVAAGLATAGRSSATAFEFSPADFNILDPTTSQLIGHVRYSLGPIDDSGLQTVSGDERYLSGEHDTERDVLQNRGPDQIPSMVTFEHDFYNADGTIARVSSANFRTGDASCTTYHEGHPERLSDTIDFPADTYAGAVVELPMQQELRSGSSGPIYLHAFNCIPGPKVIKVAAYPQAAGAWPHYVGATVEVSIKPDFGWLNLIVAPFMPEFRAWFNPASAWQFVGARFSRFYKGPEIILAYAPAQNPAPTEVPPAAPGPPQLQQPRPSAAISALSDDSSNLPQTSPSP